MTCRLLLGSRLTSNTLHCLIYECLNGELFYYCSCTNWRNSFSFYISLFASLFTAGFSLLKVMWIFIPFLVIIVPRGMVKEFKNNELCFYSYQLPPTTSRTKEAYTKKKTYNGCKVKF